MLFYVFGLDYIKVFFGCMYVGCVLVFVYFFMGVCDIDCFKWVVMDCDVGVILLFSMLMLMIEVWVVNFGNGLSLICFVMDVLEFNMDISGFIVFDVNFFDVVFL